MAIIDKIKVGSTTYDVSPSASGTLNTTGTTKFASSDVAQGSATGWTNVDQMTTADNHATLFTKITQMAKNVRYLYNVLGTGFSTSSTVKGQIDGKAPANHSHSVSQLPTSSTQVNSNDYIPTSALIYSMNQTLTSLNDASIKKLNDISITTDGYTLNGTLIGWNITKNDGYFWTYEAVWIYQDKGKLYCRYIKNSSDGSISSNNINVKANIVYT